MPVVFHCRVDVLEPTPQRAPGARVSRITPGVLSQPVHDGDGGGFLTVSRNARTVIDWWWQTPLWKQEMGMSAPGRRYLSAGGVLSPQRIHRTAPCFRRRRRLSLSGRFRRSLMSGRFRSRVASCTSSLECPGRPRAIKGAPGRSRRPGSWRASRHAGKGRSRSVGGMPQGTVAAGPAPAFTR